MLMILKFFLFLMIKYIMLMIPVLMSVAYLTLAESKMLGYSQNSKGPNIVGIYGLLQPLADGVKLFSKEIMIPNHVSMYFYFFSPILALTFSLVMWMLLPFGENMILSNSNLSLLMMFAISSISIYTILLSGWSSNSKYAFLGSLSAVAQMMSYEMCMGLMIMNVILCVGNFNLNSIIISQSNSLWFMFPLLPVSMMFFISCLAETNSAPFDLTEGESELVSGYNVEYSSMSFALFFLAEYSHMMFMSFLFSLMFLGGWYFFFKLNIFFFLKGTFLTFCFVWVSTSFPSLSYDQLMSLLWKTYLPLSFSLIIITNSFIWFLQGLPIKLCI